MAHVTIKGDVWQNTEVDLTKITEYEGLDDPYTLHSDDIDSNKPVRSYPIDMDEDEYEMLSQTRDRSVITQVKKPIRKKREEQLKEAQHLALLQKYHELLAAGISDPENINFKSLHIDNSNLADVRNQDSGELKRKNEEDLLTLLMNDNHLESIKKRSKLPNPQISDLELEQMFQSRQATNATSTSLEDSNLISVYNRLDINAEDMLSEQQLKYNLLCLPKLTTDYDIDQFKRGVKRRKEEHFQQQTPVVQRNLTTFHSADDEESISDIQKAEELIKQEMLILLHDNSTNEEFTDDELAAARSLLESEMNTVKNDQR